MEKPKYIIGCLHGCCQNNEMFKSCLKNMLSIASKENKKAGYDKFTFHFLEADYDHPDGGKTWYSKVLDVNDIKVGIPYDPTFVIPTLKKVDEFVNKNNINVLLGFSQGGNVVDSYARYMENEISTIIILSGYSFVNPEAKQVDVNFIDIFSDCDDIVPSDKHPTNYNSNKTTIIKHDKGHKVPGNPIIRKILSLIQ